MDSCFNNIPSQKWYKEVCSYVTKFHLISFSDYFIYFCSDHPCIVTLCAYAQQGYAFGCVGLCMCAYIYMYICGQKKLAV